MSNLVELNSIELLDVTGGNVVRNSQPRYKWVSAAEALLNEDLVMFCVMTYPMKCRMRVSE